MSNLASYVLVTDAENVIVFHDISDFNQDVVPLEGKM